MARSFKSQHSLVLLAFTEGLGQYLFSFAMCSAGKWGAAIAFTRLPPRWPFPDESQAKLGESPNLKTAFHALTPGRQRAYLFCFAQPKQSKTRESRVEKCRARLLKGKGLNDERSGSMPMPMRQVLSQRPWNWPNSQPMKLRSSKWKKPTTRRGWSASRSPNRRKSSPGRRGYFAGPC